MPKAGFSLTGFGALYRCGHQYHPTGAVLNGTVNANGASTNASFNYGPTNTYGFSITAAQSPVTYSEPVTVHGASNFAVVAVNGSSIVGTVNGVTGTGTTRDVTVSITSGTGEFRLRGVN